MKASHRLGFSLAVFLAAVGCGASATPPRSAASVPAVVYSPSLGSLDFVTEQVVEATHGGRTHTFRAVIHKQGSSLVIVVLTSFGVRAVTVRQEGESLEVERHLDREMPFPPAYMAADVARTLVVGLPLGASVREGESENTVGAEVFVDRVVGGFLRERIVRAAGSAERSIHIVYDAPGLAPDGTPPLRFELENPAFGYRLRITTVRFQASPRP